LKCEGLVEAYKTALLFDPRLIELIDQNLSALLQGDILLLSEVAHDCAAHKANLVSQDLREEKGMRDILNLGHTYGHVVESFNAPRVSHGQAVALGLAVALKYSQTHHRLDACLVKSGLKTCLRLAGGSFPPAPSREEALNLMKFDKKIRAGKLKFVALKGPGQAVLDTDVDSEKILEAAQSVIGS
jgi:3-dehydroquinate synthetase